MTMSDEPTSAAPSPGWKEPLAVFAGVVAALAAASVLATFWGPAADYLLLAAAIIFIGVPFSILRRQGADFRPFGIDLEKIPLRHIA